MILHNPIIITARLMAGVKIGSGFVSIGYDGSSGDGRVRYRYHIDLPDTEFSASDLESGVGGGGLQSGLESLLAFMGACGEGYRYKMSGRESDNAGLFPPAIAEFCYHNCDEISMLQIELGENDNLIIE